MGFFDFFKKKKNNDKFTVEVSTSANSSFDDNYFRLLNSKPYIGNYFGRELNAPKFNDSYETGTSYKLRELLLLVWWGNTKNGRKKDVVPPKYFFKDYSLKASTLTNKFIDDGLLEDNEDRRYLTEKGEALYNRFKPLWEIHTIKEYPINLDIMFPDWNKTNFYIYYYETYNMFLKDNIEHCSRMIQYFKYNPHFEDIGNQEEYYINQRQQDQNRIIEYQHKIDALKS